MSAGAARARLPLVLHAVVGLAVVAFWAQVACGSDECLGPLFAGTAAGVWAVTAPVVLAAASSSLRELRVIAWVVPFLWVPVAWAAAVALFLAFPSLAGV